MNVSAQGGYEAIEFRIDREAKVVEGPANPATYLSLHRSCPRLSDVVSFHLNGRLSTRGVKITTSTYSGHTAHMGSSNVPVKATHSIQTSQPLLSNL